LKDEEIKGGKESNLTVGVNWYATPNIRYMFNFIHVDTKSNSNRVIDDPNIFQVRAQLFF
ncbi:MAG: porin, partial [Gammaproteobacteria bacterium]|nr:porin [Gammaproteobacteria bacterium]